MYGLWNADISANMPSQFGNHHVSISEKKSDGYRKNTSFEIQNMAYGFNSRLMGHEIKFTTGIVDKKFGANGFYGVSYPWQWEHSGPVPGVEMKSYADRHRRISPLNP